MSDDRAKPATRSAFPWVAAGASLVFPGTGQALAGRLGRGLTFAVALAAASFGALLSFLYVPTALGIAVPLVLLLGVRVWSAVDAWRGATTHDAISWKRRAVFTAVVIAALLGIDAVNDIARGRFVGSTFRFTSGSMEPTLLEGDYFVTRPLSHSVRGGIAVFSWRRGEDQLYVFRVVAVASDTVEMRGRALYVNGDRVQEAYAPQSSDAEDAGAVEFDWQKRYITVGSAEYKPTRDSWGPLVVPVDSVFVLGDNRDNSLDSRYLGFVPISNVVAQPQRIYFSRDPDSGIRWDRIGRFVPNGAPPS